MPSQSEKPDFPPCPKCQRPVLSVVYDAAAAYGQGVSVLRHGPGHPIGKTGLIHADSCNVTGRWPTDD